MRIMPMIRFRVTRAVLGGAVLLSTTALAACKSDEVLDVTDPDVLNVGDYNTPAGAAPLKNGVLSDFYNAFSGSTDAVVVVTGTLSDEVRANDTFIDRMSVDARKIEEVNPNMETPYRGLHRARSGAARTIRVISETTPNDKTGIGEMYTIRGFAEVLFAEMYCAGVPFSEEDGSVSTFGEPQTTQQILQRAVASFDTALVIADSARVRNAASIGRARALLDLGQFAQAATAVTGVPTTYKYTTFHSTAATRQENGVWNATGTNSSRYNAANNEGKNGLNYLQTPPDPRMPWQASTRVGFNSLFTALPTQLKYARTTSVTIADGIEARLIELEAKLQGGTQADRDAVFAGLNTLRTTNTPAIAAIAGSAPTTQAAAVDLLFRERAYWMWLTAHRLGDMRRLIRQYGRDAETVFPTGDQGAPIAGQTYGPDVNFIIPFDERNNPKFTGCLDRKA
jgi:starch-binding outer membrane protein, SusD/RagB family